VQAANGVNNLNAALNLAHQALRTTSTCPRQAFDVYKRNQGCEPDTLRAKRVSERARPAPE